MMMDWLATALDLPQCFIHGGKGPGGGVIQGEVDIRQEQVQRLSEVLNWVTLAS